MGSQWVDDPGWNNIFSGFVSDMAGAPGKALSNIAQAEAIKDARIKRARDQEQWDLSKKAVGGFDAAVPPAYAPPTNYTAVGPYTGDASDPATTAGLPSVDLQFTDPRALAAAEARRKFLVNSGSATILKDPSQGPAQLGYASVGAAGVPQTQQERSQLQFLTTGRFPTAEERAMPTAHNYTIYDANGQPTGRSYSTRDGRTTIDGVPVASLIKPGERPLATGPASADVKNPIENQAIAQENFAKMAAKAQAGPLSQAEIEQAYVLANAAFPETISMQPHPTTGAMTPSSTRAGLPTAGNGARLLELIDGYNQQLHLPPEQRRPATQPRLVQPAGAAPAATDPNAAPPPPPAAPSFVSARVGAPATTGNPAPIVQRYMHNPVVVSMENAKNGYSALVGNMPYNNAASDLAIVIGAAKVLDPPSVVREGEVENVRKTGGPVDQFIGMLDKAGGGAGLTEQVRAQLWQMVNAKLELDIKNMLPLREQHAVQLHQGGLDPNTYLPALPQLAPVDRSIINKKDVRAAPGATTSPPPAIAPRGADALVGGG